MGSRSEVSVLYKIKGLPEKGHQDSSWKCSETFAHRRSRMEAKRLVMKPPQSRAASQRAQKKHHKFLAEEMESERDIIVKLKLSIIMESVAGWNLFNMINAPLSTEHNLEII